MRLLCGILVLFAMSVASDTTVRYLSYNIQSGSGMDGKYDLNRTAKAIVDSHADIVALQEVDNRTRRHPDDQTLLLSRTTGLQYFSYAKFRDFQGGGYGIAILSRWPHIDVRIHRFIKPEPSTGSSGQRRAAAVCGDPVEGDYCQGVLCVLIALPDGTVSWICNSHFGIGLNNTQQIEEARQTIAFVETQIWTTYPCVFMGDLNSEPDQAPYRILNEPKILHDGWIDGGQPPGDPGFTFPSDKPNRRIDYLWLSYGRLLIDVDDARVLDTQASDHRPLLTTLSYQ